MTFPSIADAQRVSEVSMKKKTKVLRGETAKNVVAKVTKKDEPKKKTRSASEVRTAMYGEK